MLRPIDYGYPLSVSRNTDIPAFWMDRWFTWMDRGWVHSSDPRTGLPAIWSVKPEDTHSIFWWSKNFRPLLDHSRVGDLSAYRNYFAFTIRGDPSTEPKVPSLGYTLDTLQVLSAKYGPDKVQWRYSPVPQDIEWETFTRIVRFVSGVGIRECYFSFLHEDGLLPEMRTNEEKKATVLRMAQILDARGMTLHGCWADEWLMGIATNTRIASCLNAQLIGNIYGMSTRGYEREDSCLCTKSVDVASQKLLPCGHRCTYCYAVPR